MDSVLAYIDQHVEEYVSRVRRACRQPSIAAQNVGMGEMAQMVAEMLEGVAKVFGDTKLLGPDMYKVYLIDKIAESSARLMVVRYGVKAKGFLQKLAQSVKSVETLAFLRTNPGYFMRNLVNNEFTMLARGAWSWSPEAGVAFWRQMGFEPARLRAGFGYAGDIGLAVGEG